MKQIGVTSNGNALVEISSAAAKGIVTCLQSMGAVLATLDGLLTLAPEEKAEGAGLRDGVQAPRGPTAPLNHQEAAGKKRTEKGHREAAPAKPSGRVCATRTASGESRQCIQCGKAFSPRRKDQTCCGKACRKLYANRAKAKPTREERDAAGRPTRPCQDCGGAFEPWRKDQRFCSVCAKKSHPGRPKQAAAAPAAAPAAVRSAAATPPPDRLQAIREADRRARLKAGGIVPPTFGVDDSGIREASDEDIAAVRGKGGEE